MVLSSLLLQVSWICLEWDGGLNTCSSSCVYAQVEGDLCYWIEHLGACHELNIVAIHVDPLANSAATDFFFSGTDYGDLLDDQHAWFLLELIHSGKVIGGFASPRVVQFPRPVTSD